MAFFRKRDTSNAKNRLQDCGDACGRAYCPHREREKKAVGNPVTPAPAKVRVFRAIRLQPSNSDYGTFTKTTALAMGKPAKAASTPKPNTRLLSLLNLGV